MKTRHKPRILMLLENANYPDDTRVMLEALSLASAGFEVTVISPTGDHRRLHEVVDGIRVYRYWAIPEMGGLLGYVLEFGYSLIAAFLLSLWVYLRHGVDAVHVHAPPDMNALVGVFYRLLGKRFVLDTHDLSPELYNAQKAGHGNRAVIATLKWFERLACRWASRLIATNQSQREVQIQRAGARPQNCLVVRNGPNAMFLEHAEPWSDLESDPRVKLGYVGMIGTQDGVQSLIDALVELRSRGREFLAVIVGDGPALADLRSSVEHLHLSDGVRFTGMVPFEEVPRWIASFDICVTPDPQNEYNDSCTTIKTMEYMAQGKPTVAFNTKENRITAEDAALYAADDSITSLADALERLIDDVDLRVQMGRNGRQRVLDALAWSHQEAALVGLYENLFQIKASARPAMAEARTMSPTALSEVARDATH